MNKLFKIENILLNHGKFSTKGKQLSTEIRNAWTFFPSGILYECIRALYMYKG